MTTKTTNSRSLFLNIRGPRLLGGAFSQCIDLLDTPLRLTDYALGDELRLTTIELLIFISDHYAADWGEACSITPVGVSGGYFEFEITRC